MADVVVVMGIIVQIIVDGMSIVCTGGHGLIEVGMLRIRGCGYSHDVAM